MRQSWTLRPLKEGTDQHISERKQKHKGEMDYGSTEVME